MKTLILKEHNECWDSETFEGERLKPITFYQTNRISSIRKSSNFLFTF